MKPLTILAIGGISLATTLAFTDWLGSRQAAAREPGHPQCPAAMEAKASGQEEHQCATTACSSNLSRSHGLMQKADPGQPGGAAQTAPDSK